MNGLSNLPPGCSSPDGGIDHEWEAAFEQLAEALPVMPDQELEQIADDLQHAHYVAAFAKLCEADGKGTQETAKLFFEALTAEYSAGFKEGKEAGIAEYDATLSKAIDNG